MSVRIEPTFEWFNGHCPELYRHWAIKQTPLSANSNLDRLVRSRHARDTSPPPSLKVITSSVTPREALAARTHLSNRHPDSHALAIHMKRLGKLRRVFTAFLTASVIMLVAPLSVDAENEGIPRIGYLAAGPPSPEGPGFDTAFRNGLSDIGYVEGKNIKIEWRYAAGKADSLPPMAAELVRLKVEVIVTDSTLATVAAKDATKSLPIIFATAVDPVTAGIVGALGRPGGNITGFAVILSELVGKRLQLLKETFPGVKQVAVVWTARNPGHRPALKELESAGRILRVNIEGFPVDSPAGFEPAFARMSHWGADAVLVFDDVFLDFHGELIARLAIKGRLPSIFGYRVFVDRGGLMSYGPDLADQFRRSGRMVDKILKGTKAADIPVEQPTRFELVVNLKTMKALGITMPPSILTRADEVIR